MFSRFPQTGVFAAAAWIAAVLGFLALARGLPAETFFVGDPGVKLIAARQGHPDRPLEIPLPTIGGERVPYVEPFFAVHGDHSHAVTSEIFPLASAPFIEILGIRGAYLLPAFGFFISLAASARLAQTLDVRRKPLGVILTVALGTPLLFYGLEFWEHAPAVAVATTATALLLTATKRNTSDRSRAFVAGLLFGVAILLRPEAVCFFIAVLAASRLLSAPPNAASLLTAAAGVVLTVLPLGVYSLLHFGTIVPPHIGSHAALLTGDWFATRGHSLSRWFVPDSLAIGELWGIALLALLAFGWFGAARCNSRAFLVAAALIDIVLVVLTAPNDGGGQWGPRYLLCAFVPAGVLAAGFFEAPARRETVSALVVVLALGTGVWAQRDGYRELRVAKLTYGRVLDFVRREVPPLGTAVTDLWWLDQVAAAATGERQILFAATPDIQRDALRRLAATGLQSVTFIRSREDSSDVPTWLGQPCYVMTGQREIPERALVAIQLRRNCS